MDLEEFFDDTRKEIDEELQKTIKGHPECEKLRYVLEGGKRLRPVLTILTFKALRGKNYGRALKTAVATELMHSASLVHDDIIDGDKERRGKTPAYMAHGVKDAVLLGHRMISLGLRSIVNHGTEVTKTVLNAWDAALRGETEDVAIMRKKLRELTPPIKNIYFNLILNKTASLFAGACKLGAQEADADEKLQELFWNYGEQIGLAYQLADDYVDMKRGKIETFPLVWITQFEENVRNLFFRLVEEGRASPLEFFGKLGFDARRFFMNEIVKCLEDARKVVESAEIRDTEYKNLLLEAPTYVVNQMLKEAGESLP